MKINEIATNTSPDKNHSLQLSIDEIRLIKDNDAYKKTIRRVSIYPIEKYSLVLLQDFQGNILGKAKVFESGKAIDPEGQGWLTMTESEVLVKRFGLGTEMYLGVLEALYPKKMRPEFQTSSEAKALWAKLRKNPKLQVLDDDSVRYKK
jgi:hypothetical protein